MKVLQENNEGISKELDDIRFKKKDATKKLNQSVVRMYSYKQSYMFTICYFVILNLTILICLYICFEFPLTTLNLYLKEFISFEHLRDTFFGLNFIVSFTVA